MQARACAAPGARARPAATSRSCRPRGAARRRRWRPARSSAWPWATRQPSPTSPIRSPSRDPHVGQEHLVELGLAGELAQRPDLHAGRRSCRRRSRSARRAWARPGRCGRPAAPQRAWWASEVHTFCPLTRQSCRRRCTARVARPARSDPAPGSLNSWHQTSSPVHSGRSQRGLLLVGAERQDRGRGHAQADRRSRLGSLSGAPAAANSASTTGLQRARQAQAAEAGRVVHPGQARVEPGPQEVEPGQSWPGRGPARKSRTRSRSSSAPAGRAPASVAGTGQHSGPPAT